MRGAGTRGGGGGKGDTQLDADYAAAGVVLYNSVDQAIANNLMTELDFDTERDAAPSAAGTWLSSGRLKVPATVAARRWTIDALVSFAVNGTGDRIIEVKRYIAASTTTEVLCRGSDAGLSGTERMIRAGVSVKLSPGDEVYIEAYQTSGGSLNVKGGDLRWTFLSLASYSLDA